jgi:hypothetical protein
MGRYVTNTAWLVSGVGDPTYIQGLSSTAINTATVNDFILQREAMIDSYVGKHWNPTDYATAPVIASMARGLVTFDIYETIFNADGGIQEKPQNVDNNYKLSLAMLQDFRDASAEIFTSDGTRIVKRNLASKYLATNRDYIPTFDVDNPLNWSVSKQRLDDVSQDRENDRG